MGPVQPLLHGVVHLTFARVADQKVLLTMLKKAGRREEGTNLCDAPSKCKSRLNTPSLSTLKQVFDLQKDANAEQQSASVNNAEIISSSADTSGFSFSVMPFIMQICIIKGMSGPLGSSMISKSVIPVCSTHVKNACDTVRNGTFSPIVVLSSMLFEDATVHQLPFVLCLCDGRFKIGILRTMNIIAPAINAPRSMVRCHWNTSGTGRIVRPVPSK